MFDYGGCLMAILFLLALLAVSYFAVAFLVWLICLAFKISFSWLLALGIWAILFLIGTAVK